MLTALVAVFAYRMLLLINFVFITVDYMDWTDGFASVNELPVAFSQRQRISCFADLVF